MTYIIQEDILALRYFEEEDFDVFLEYRNDPDIAAYQGWNVPFTPQDGLNFFLSMKDRSIYTTDAWLQLVIENTDDKSIIGDCAYKVSNNEAEFGITIRKQFQNQGYATRGVKLLFELLFEQLKLHRVIAVVASENLASIMLMGKLSMRREAHFVKSWYNKSTASWEDEYQFAILEEEFLASEEV